MKSLPMNLSSMKKIAGDAKSTTFKHKDGHEIKVAHSALPALQRKQLEKLPMQHYDDGTAAATPAPQQTATPDPDNTGEQQAQDSFNNAQGSAGWQNIKGALGLAKGGKVQRYAGGTENAANTSATDYGNVNANVGNLPQGNTPNLMYPNGLVNAPAALQTEQQGETLGAQAIGAAGQAGAANEQGRINAQMQTDQQQQNAFKELKGHADDFRDYNLANPINENHWAESKSTGQKIGIATGLMLGGFANGVTGKGGNPSLDFINRQIDRDIDAQKARAGQQNNIWGAYKDLYNSETIANHMTRAALDDIHAANTAKIADQIATPLAQSNNLKAQAAYALDKQDALMKGAQAYTIETERPGQANQTPQQQGEQPPTVASINGQGQAVGVPQQGRPNQSAPMQASPDQEIPKVEGYTPMHILKPNALKTINNAEISGLPGWGDLGQAREDAQNAAQLEKVFNGVKGDGVGSLDDYMSRMYNNSGKGNAITGAGGAVQRAGSKVFNAASHLIGGHGTDLSMPAYSSATKEYETNQQNLKTMLASSLHGLISVNDLDTMLDKYSPGYLDKPSDVQYKRESFKNELMRALKMNSLETHKLLVNPPKR